MAIISLTGVISDLENMINTVCLNADVDHFLPLPFDQDKLSAKTTIENFTSEMRSEINCYLEYPYVDKLYRDSYYNHYSKKHFNYNRNCIRVSFFDCKLKKDDFRDAKIIKKFQEENYFLGYMVIRPIRHKRVGRTFISPTAFKKANFISCLVSDSVQINGDFYHTNGFPYCPQDDEYMTCSETTIWSIMEYFGTKYKDYKTILPSQINLASKKLRHERISPSDGLSELEISYTLRKFGFGTRIYRKDNFPLDKSDTKFEKVFNDYVESGIPIVVMVSKIPPKEKLKKDEKEYYLKNSNRHSFLVIGHEKTPFDKLKYEPNPQKIYLENDESKKIKIEISDSGLILDEKQYIIIDDNHAPYRSVTFHNPKYNDEDFYIDSFIVPFHKKVHLESMTARTIAINAMESNEKDLKYTDYENSRLIYRVLLTSSRSFKTKIPYNFDVNSVDENMIKWILLELEMPKFIWIVEFGNLDSYKNNKCQGFFVIDATSINSSKKHAARSSIIAIIYNNKITSKSNDVNKFDQLDTISELNYNQYSSNLKNPKHEY